MGRRYPRPPRQRQLRRVERLPARPRARGVLLGTLDPNWPPNEVMGWEHVLGSERCVALTCLLERLTPALPTATASAIKGSLAAWQRVARDPAWRSGTNPEAPVFLRHQVNAWRDMLIVGADPQTFERAPRPLQEVANIIPIIKGLWVQIVAALLSAGILAAGAWAITRYGTASHGER